MGQSKDLKNAILVLNCFDQLAHFVTGCFAVFIFFGGKVIGWIYRIRWWVVCNRRTRQFPHHVNRRLIFSNIDQRLRLS